MGKQNIVVESVSSKLHHDTSVCDKSTKLGTNNLQLILIRKTEGDTPQSHVITDVSTFLFICFSLRTQCFIYHWKAYLILFKKHITTIP